MTNQRYHVRFFIAAVIIGSIFTGLFVRIGGLHLNTEKLGISRRSSHVQRRLYLPRGRIFDKNGSILGLDTVQKELYADPAVLVSNGVVEKASSAISDILGLSADVLVQRLNRPDRRFAFVAGYGRRISQEQAKAIERLSLPGIYTEDVLVRSYPRGASMCHVIGFVNLKGDGSAGIELSLDKYLRSVPGFRLTEVDARGSELYDRRNLNISPHKGANVYLTLDQNIQHIVETALADVIEENDAKAAWAIVQEISTGAILAMTSLPRYNLNQFRDTSPDERRNRCIANVYEPGSTFKIVTVSSALDAGVVTPSDVFDCEGGIWFYQNRPLRDYHAHEDLAVADIIKKSSNIGAAKIALRLGNQRLYKYLRAYMIGTRMGVELPGEEAGILRPVDNWSLLSPTRIAMGHEVAVSSLQMLSAMSAIANDGRMMRPYCIEKIVTSHGRVVFKQAPAVQAQPIREETAVVMQRLLTRVTEDGGTGRRARVEGYKVAGKTGTAQKALPGGYSSEAHVASFVGFLPAVDPKIGIIVVVDEPGGRFHTGGTVAAPVFRKIAAETVRYLNISPAETATVRNKDSRRLRDI